MDARSRDESRNGWYDFAWLPEAGRAPALARLGICPDDF